MTLLKHILGRGQRREDVRPTDVKSRQQHACRSGCKDTKCVLCGGLQHRPLGLAASGGVLRHYSDSMNVRSASEPNSLSVQQRSLSCACFWLQSFFVCLSAAGDWTVKDAYTYETRAWSPFRVPRSRACERAAPSPLRGVVLTPGLLKPIRLKCSLCDRSRSPSRRRCHCVRRIGDAPRGRLEGERGWLGPCGHAPFAIPRLLHCGNGVLVLLTPRSGLRSAQNASISVAADDVLPTLLGRSSPRAR